MSVNYHHRCRLSLPRKSATLRETVRGSPGSSLNSTPSFVVGVGSERIYCVSSPKTLRCVRGRSGCPVRRSSSTCACCYTITGLQNLWILCILRMLCGLCDYCVFNHRDYLPITKLYHHDTRIIGSHPSHKRRRARLVAYLSNTRRCFLGHSTNPHKFNLSRYQFCLQINPLSRTLTHRIYSIRFFIVLLSSDVGWLISYFPITMVV